MSNARLLPKIDHMLAELSSLREEIAREQPDGEPEPTYLSIDDYARRAHVSPGTVQRWLRAGLPCMRRGHVVRIKVAEADAWTPAGAREKSASHAAHRGGR